MTLTAQTEQDLNRFLMALRGELAVDIIGISCNAGLRRSAYENKKAMQIALLKCVDLVLAYCLDIYNDFLASTMVITNPRTRSKFQI